MVAGRALFDADERKRAANVDDRAELGKLADAAQQGTGETVELLYVD